jgi:hypothetical protein
MRRVFMVLVLLCAARSAAAQQQRIPTTIPEKWNAWCARCHGLDGVGKVAVPTVPVEPMDFSDCKIATAEPDADWEMAITHGGPAVGLSSQMPAFGDVLSPEDVRSFVGHIRGFCKETGWPSGNLNLPRPIFTEKAFPENEVVILPMASHAPNQRARYELRTIYERRIGRRAQIEAVLPVESIYLGSRQNGLGDVEVGLKYALTPRWRHLVSAGLDVAFGTGQEAELAGTTGAVIEPYIATATVLGNAYLQGQFKMEFPTESSWRSRETIFHVYLGRDTSGYPNTWTVGVELSGENTELDLTPQIRKGLTRTGALAAAFGVSLPLNERDERGVRWVGYLLWEYLEPVLARR